MFEGISPNRGDTLKSRVYFADINGKLGAPSAEINAAEFAEDTDSYNLSDITRKVIIALKNDRYL